MTEQHSRASTLPGRIAGHLGISRGTARALLAIDRDLRAQLLTEIARVGAGRVLAFTQTQPSAAPE